MITNNFLLANGDLSKISVSKFYFAIIIKRITKLLLLRIKKLITKKLAKSC